MQTDAESLEAAKIEAEAKKLDAARLAKTEEFITEVLEKELAKAPEKEREPLRTAYRTEMKKRTADQTKRLKAWPRVNQLSAGSLYLYDTTNKTKHADTLKKMTEEATAVRGKKPVEEFLHAFVELPQKPELVPATFIFNRGNHEQPKEKVPPSDLTVLAAHRKIEVSEKDAKLPTTGRRLAFANALTDGKHPLLARVMANRVWMHHFGKGIVEHEEIFDVLREAGERQIGDNIICVSGTTAWKVFTVTNTVSGTTLVEKKFHKSDFGDMLKDPQYKTYLEDLIDAVMVRTRDDADLVADDDEENE